jgi:hypothetical protein
MSKMDDKDLVRAIEHLETAAEDGTLADNRTQALDYYRGENVNPAPEGRSQVVDRSVYDVCESLKGPILKLFLSGDEVVKFTPRGPEDIQAAEQETAYVNWVLTEKNDAFSLFSGWLHDALLQKNSYVLAYWKDDEYEREKYKGLSLEEFQALLQSGDAQPVEIAETIDDYGTLTIDATIQRTTAQGCVHVVNVPPESVLVDPNATTVSLAQSAFVMRREDKTLSELRAMGFDVEDDISDGGNSVEDFERDARKERSWQLHDEDVEPDPSMRRVKVRECWIRCDYDGDGEAELRHVIVVGTTVLLNEEADLIPLVAFSAKPLPHQHYGESLYDEIKEVQDAKTALLRGVLDALYLANSPRHAINADRVNLDDMLVSRPGGLVRVEGDPMGAVLPLSEAYNPAPALSTLEYMDTVRETRTGVTRVGTGLDPNALNRTASGIAMLQGAQSQRIELVARYFATAVTELCSVVHALTLKHSRRASIVQLRNEWVPVDPRQWTRRKDMSINVGLGTGNRQEQMAFLMQMLQLALGPGVQLGFSAPDKLYAMLTKLSNAAGFKNAEEFWVNPKNAPPPQPQQPPPPDPKLIEVQQRGQIEQAKLQQSAQFEQAKAQQDAQMEMSRAQAEMMLEREKAQMQAEIARYKAELDAQVALEVARIRAQADVMRPINTMGMSDGLS